MTENRFQIPQKKRVFLSSLFILYLFFFLPPAFSSDFSLSQVISVDKTAPSALQAKKIALQEGEETAIQRLYFFLQQALTPSDYFSSPIEEKELKAFLTGYEVLTEKNSTTRYIAKIKYQFNDTELNKLFQERKWKLNLPPEKKLLIIPMMQKKESNQESYFLWESTPWLDAWKRQIKNMTFLPIALPLADIEDITTLQPETAIEGLYPAFQYLQKRYKTSMGVMVLIAAPVYEENYVEEDPAVAEQKTEKKLLGLKIYLLHGFIPQDQNPPAFFVEKNENESEIDFFNRAAQKTYAFIVKQWRAYKDLINDPSKQSIPFNQEEIIIPLSSSYDWFFWRDMLKSITKSTNITKFHLKSLSIDQAHGVISFYGNISTLEKQLKRLQLHLTFHKNKWILRSMQKTS